MTTTTRPPGFDAALVAYLPTLRRQANFVAKSKHGGEEILQEAVAIMLHRAESCRMETFKTWALLRLREAGSNMWRAGKRKMRTGRHVAIEDTPLSVPASQHDAVDLADALDRLGRIHNGDIVIKQAMGSSFEEMGAESGTSRENIRQKCEKARATLNKRLGRRAAA